MNGVVKTETSTMKRDTLLAIVMAVAVIVVIAAMTLIDWFPRGTEPH